MRRVFQRVWAALLTLMMVCMFSVPAIADSSGGLKTAEEQQMLSITEKAGSIDKAKRTIMLYDCGTDLESKGKMASYNLRQILRAEFSSDDDIRFIVMTGGADKWHLEKDYLEFPDDVPVPANAVEEPDPDDSDKWIVAEDNKSRISNVYNQIWEAKGADDPVYGGDGHGRMVLLDGDGVLGDGDTAKRSKIDLENDAIVVSEEYGYRVFDDAKMDCYEWMNDPEVLKAFINFCVDYAPAEKYDLILWDHGLGTIGGFCSDEQERRHGYDNMTLDEIIDAFSDNKVVDADLDGRQDGKFDLVDFDACMMSSVEIVLSIADYMDCLVASPHVEPGYGQNYEYWLNELGDPGKDGVFNGAHGTFELGKKIVDDFIAFYDKEQGDGASQEGTLAVLNINKLMTDKKNPASGSDDPEPLGFVEALSFLSANLRADLVGGKYYDEFRSFKSSLEYNEMYYYDLGNLVSQLAYEFFDADLRDLTPDGKLNDTNLYTEIADIIMGFLSDPEIVYARGTKGIHTNAQYYRTPTGEIKFGEQTTSGIYMAFNPQEQPTSGFQTCHSELPKVIEKIEGLHPDRAELLRSLLLTMETYGLAYLTGDAVTEMVSEGAEKKAIDYDAVKAYWETEGELDDNGNNLAQTYIDALGGDAVVKGWLQTLIRLMRNEAVMEDQIRSESVETDAGTGQRIMFDNVFKQAINSVQCDIVAELPVAEAFLNDPENKQYLKHLFNTPTDMRIGTISGTEVFEVDPEKAGYEAVVDWLHTLGSTWNLDPPENKWYAFRDADGNLSVAGAELFGDEIQVPTGYFTWEIRDAYDLETDSYIPKLQKICHIVFFIFNKDKNGEWDLTEIAIRQDSGSYRFLEISEFIGELEVQPLQEIENGFFKTFLPISDSYMKLTHETLQKIRLEYVDISDIPDIADTDGDGEAVRNTVTVTNIYGHQLDITDKVFPPDSSFKNPFTDIADSNFFYDPVLWAVKHDPLITRGTSDTTFSPENACTRGQAVTFLWRAAGAEKVTDVKNPFTDVKEGSYYYDAVLWAYKNGVTAGTTDTTFSPDDVCSRGQSVTFLWRSQGKKPSTASISFTDVASGAFYYDAVKWAVEKEVTKGTTATTFSPSADCTRGQIITFLYRAMN